ncbi:MAG: Asp-tRNA(Asn)/Glu-tRNA(Gln) amidotransferase GatCAB subunit A [Gammaproteobacteria bacterium]|nr:MAG: Asp-tRNA(Asn)/Glu-tRNA(Gln) amidotransferase GatCAB subunit A [Gammaproteobacteria bacterium]
MSIQFEHLHYLTITQASELIHSGKISATELTQHILDRISHLDPEIKSYATVMREEALAAAHRADQELASGKDRGPLHGIPVAVKDLCFTKNAPTKGGMAVFADHVPDYDATVVTRLAEAGAILIGKLNLTEGAMIGYHHDFAIPANPWALDRWAGASSSGSGAATAAGLAYATLGSDTGGSIRFPSAACGVVGLKPTWGRVSRYGIIPLAESLDHIGPLTRCTRDAALIFEAIAGADDHDPTSLLSPVPPITEVIANGISGVRIGIDRENIEKHADPEVAAGVFAGADVLAKLGANIITVDFPNTDTYIPAWSDVCLAETALAHETTFPARREDYGLWMRNWLDKGQDISGVDYARANNLRHVCRQEYRALLQTVDLLLMPSIPILPPVFKAESLYGAVEGFDFGLTRYTAVFDFTGSPTLSLPCGLSREGLPLSLQLVARHEDEQLLCQAGHAYEQATDWHTLHPPFIK